ncbi:MAG: Crp/Fnr family transcriptional regulator [Micavibrio sp.]
MPLQEDQTVPFLRGLPFFSELPEDDLTAFLKAGTLREYKKQQPIFQQGDPADRLFVVMQGWVKLYRNTEEGDESIVALFTRGDVFGEAAIFSGVGYPFAAEAAEPTKLIEIPGAVLRDRARGNHEVMARIMHSMSHEMRNLQMENEHLTLMSAPQRVGCLLLQLAGKMIGNGGTLRFPYDKSLAAARLGMKPETFSRALAQLQPVSVTIKGAEVKIDSFASLVEYCCSHCSSLPGECRGSRSEYCGSASKCSGKNTP